MIVRFRRGNITETRPVHGKLDHHVSAARKRDGYKQLPVSVEFTKYGNTLFRPVPLFEKILDPPLQMAPIVCCVYFILTLFRAQTILLEIKARCFISR